MSLIKLVKILMSILIVFYHLQTMFAIITLENSTFHQIPDLIQSNILKPFYQTSNCIHFWNDIKDLKTEQEPLVTSSLMLSDNFKTELKECANVLIFVQHLDELSRCINFKERKRNILILSFGTVSSNNDFMIKQSVNFGISNVLLVSGNSGDIYFLNSPFNTNRKFVKKTSLSIKAWTVAKKTLPNLNGKSIRATTSHSPIYVIVDPIKGKDNVQGIEMLIVKELAKQLNFTISLHLVEDTNKWGTHLKNGTWVNGIMGALSNGFAELGFCSIFITYKQGKVLDYTPSWSKLYMTYLVPRQDKLNGQWRSIFHSFNMYLWLAIISAITVMALIHWGMTWIKYNMGIFQGIISFQSSIFGLIGVLTIGSHVPYITNNNRYLVISWYVFTLIITSAYSSSIVSILTSPLYEDKIDTVKQLVEKKIFWGLNYKINDTRDFFNLENNWQHKFSKNMLKRTVMEKDLSGLIASKQFALLSRRLDNDYIYPLFTNISDEDLSHLYSMEEHTREYQISISFRKYSPLFPPSYRIIRRLIEAGITHYWLNDVIRNFGSKAIMKIMLERNRDISGNPVKLSINNLQGALYLLFLGYCLATLCFIAEYIHFRLHYIRIELAE